MPSLLSGLKTAPDVKALGDAEAKNARHEMRKKYHGIILQSIAQQCPIINPDTGEPFPLRIAIMAWKRKFHDLFHPHCSSESLSNEEYSDLINTVEAHGAQELGVTYPPPP